MNKNSIFTILLLLSVGNIESSGAQTAIIDAEQTYLYISSTLHTFNTTGRLVDNPGVDGSDLESFLALLEFYSEQFSGEFNSKSSMCEFYSNPKNSLMNIEEKAQVSYSFLRSLEERIEDYLSVNDDFQEELALQFGTFLLDNINQAKKQSASHLRLPSKSFDEAAVVNFLESACL